MGRGQEKGVRERGTVKGKAQERDGKGDIWCGHRGSPEDKIQCNDTFCYIFIFGRYSPGEPTCQL